MTLCGLAAAPAPAAPATQPAQEQGKILILPFVAVNKNDSQPWLGRSVQQSLAADLTMAAPERATTSDTEATDNDSAVAAGRKADAAYVVTGTFTTVGQDLRLTGQVLDVATGRALGGLKATGTINDIFPLEDALARQIKVRLGLARSPSRPGASEQPIDAGAMAPLRAEQAPPADQYYQTYATPPSTDYTYNYYYTTPDYGYYDYPYYWGYPGYGYLYVSPSFGFRGHFHEGFRSRGFSGGFHSHGFSGGIGGHVGGRAGGGHVGGRR